MNITKNDLFYVFMSIVVATIGVIAVSNANTKVGLYGLLGLLAIAVVMAIIIRPSLGANILVFAIFTNISDALIKQGFPGIIKPLVAIVSLALLIRYIYAGQLPVWHRKTVRIEFFLLAYFMMVIASFLAASDKDQVLTEILDLGKDMVIIYCIIFALRDSQSWKQTTWLIIITTAALCCLSLYQLVTNNYTQTFFKLASLFMLGIILYIILNTYSRGAYLILAIDVVLILFVFEKRFNPIVAFAGLSILILLIPFLPATYRDRFITLSDFTAENGIYQDTSFRGRTSEMLTGLTMFASHPILGVGAGNYPINYQHYAQLIGIEFRAEARDPHSLYVQVLAETGIIGAIVFLGIVFSLIQALNKACRNIERSPHLHDWLPWISAIRLAIISYLLTSVFLHNAYIRYFWILLAMALAVIQITDSLLKNSERSSSIEVRR